MKREELIERLWKLYENEFPGYGELKRIIIDLDDDDDDDYYYYYDYDYYYYYDYVYVYDYDYRHTIICLILAVEGEI